MTAPSINQARALAAPWQRGPIPLDAANDTPKLRRYIVAIKHGRETRLLFEAMGTSSMSVTEQHAELCEAGEYISVRPA